MAAMMLKSIEEKSIKNNEGLDDVISEKVKIESAKQQLRLEKLLTFKFQEMIENKMADLEIKTETKLLSKYKKDFENLEAKLRKQRKSTEDSDGNLVTKEEFLKLKGEFKNIKSDLNKDLQRKCDKLKKELKESSKNFIEGILEVKCEEIEKKSFSNLEVKCQKHSEEIKSDLFQDIEIKLKENLELEKTILLNEIKSEVNFKGNEIKLKAIQELNEEFTERLQNETCNLEKSFNDKYESEKSKMKDELKTVLSSEIHFDITSLLERHHVILQKSLNFIWEIPDFNDKIANHQFDNSYIHTWTSYLTHLRSPPHLSIESEVFNLYEIGCKLKFIFHLHPDMYFEVKYVDRPSDEVFAFNDHQRITFILHDQVDSQLHNDFIRIFEPTFRDWTNHTLFRCSTTKDQLSFLHSRWLKNGTVQVKVQMEPLDRITTLEPRHYGHFIWKIDRFKDVLESFRYGRQYSLKLSIRVKKGYRMKGCLFVGDKVYFTLYFLKGPWDHELPKTFKHRTTISLISQKDQSELKDKMISKESSDVDWDTIYDLTKTDLEKYMKVN